VTDEEDNLHPIPKNWVWAIVGDVAVVASGSTPSTKEPDFWGGEIPWITPADLTDYEEKFIGKGARNITKKGLNACSTRLVPTGTVLFSSRAPIGYVAIAKNPIATNQGFKNLILSEGIFNEYIYHYLKGNKQLAERSGSGTTFKELSATRFRKIPVPIPPTREQYRIVTKVEELFTKLDAGVKSLQNVKVKLQLYRQAILKHAFEGKLTEDWRKSHKHEIEPATTLLEHIKEERKEKGKYKELPPLDTSDLPELPESWVWTRIGDISLKIHYGYTAKSTNEPIGPKMLRITDIQKSAVNWGMVPYCKIEEEKKPKYLLKDGDLVFARTGATVGKSFLIKGKIPKAVFASYLIRIILSSRIKREYVYNFFQSPIYWLQIYEGQIGIGQPNVNSQKLSKLFLPLPSLNEQHKIVEEIDSLFSVADEVEKVVEQTLKQSKHLRQSILKKAFEGRLVPQDPTDEPADKLLERIREEKEKHKSEKKGKRKGEMKQLELIRYVK